MNKPNILFFLTNDPRFATTRSLGNRHIQAPHSKRPRFITMSKVLFVCTSSIFILGYPLVAQESTALSEHEMEAAQALAERIDLSRPGMETMADAIAVNDHRAVLDLFRARVVKRLRAMDFSEASVGTAANRQSTADAEMMLGRMTPDEYKARYHREWIDTYSGITPEDYPILQASGLMAPPGTPIQWLGPDGNSQRVGQYIGSWGGGGWGFNTALVEAWWYSGEAIYKEKWFEICEGYFQEYHTAATRQKFKATVQDPASFHPLTTAWRIHRSFLPALALIAKHPDHESKPPPFPQWLTNWPPEAVMKGRQEANGVAEGEVSAEQLEAIPAAPLARIAIGLTEETAPYLIKAYITGDYFFANQNYDGILAVATIALIFDDLKKSRELEAIVDKAFPWWAGRVIYRDGGPLEQDFHYSLGYAAEFEHQSERFASHGSQSQWLDEFQRLSLLAMNFWDHLQTPQGLLPCVGNSKYRAKAPRRAYPQVSTYFPYSGYAGLRTPGAPDDQLFMMFANSRRSKGHLSPNTGSMHITAYGRDLIAPGGSPSYGLTAPEHKAEEAAFDNYAGEHSTYKNSTVIMNGLSQATFHRGRFLDWFESAPDTPVPTRWLSNDTFDYVESKWIGYERRQKNSPYAPVVEYDREIEHHRQVVFIKSAGLWLLVDIMGHKPYLPVDDGREGDTTYLLRSAVETVSPFTFTQIWNFAPPHNEAHQHDGFSDEQVKIDEAERRVITDDPSGVNLELLHFGGMPLNYRKYFGHKDEKMYLGWLVGAGGGGTPRVDLHANWEQTREDLLTGRVMPLVTVIAPSRDAQSVVASAKPRVEQDGRVSGCEFTMQDGKTITFLASAAPTELSAGELVAHAELLVIVDSPGDDVQRGILLGCTSLHIGKQHDALQPVETPDFEFTFDGKNVTVLQAVAVPSEQPTVLTSGSGAE